MKFVELWTDAKNRPAVELVMGTVLVVPTFLYAFGLFGKPDGGVLIQRRAAASEADDGAGAGSGAAPSTRPRSASLR